MSRSEISRERPEWILNNVQAALSGLGYLLSIAEENLPSGEEIGGMLEILAQALDGIDRKNIKDVDITS